MDLKIKDSESELQYIWRVCSAKDAGTLDMTWDEVADILNQNLRSEDEAYTSSAYRKKYQQAKNFYDEVFSKMESKEYSDTLMAQKRELERLKIQFRDERNAWNKQNYTDARVSQKLDYLEQALAAESPYTLSIDDVPVRYGDNDLLVILSDLHIGQTFNSRWGEYNTEVAAERMSQYLHDIIEIGERHHSESVYVSIQGDLISNSIHKSIQVTNRENVIDQIKIASDLITEFLFNLAKSFKSVTVTNVSGNHSRLDKKEDAIHDERLDDLISWICKSRLTHCQNIFFEDENLDVGIAEMKIRGNTVINVHGDFDAFSKSGVSNLCMMLGFVPDIITMGHLHTCALDECNGVKMIRGGSLAGSGDDYTIEKRLTGKPSQMVCVITAYGVEACYPCELI